MERRRYMVIMNFRSEQASSRRWRNRKRTTKQSKLFRFASHTEQQNFFDFVPASTWLLSSSFSPCHHRQYRSPYRYLNHQTRPNSFSCELLGLVGDLMLSQFGWFTLPAFWSFLFGSNSGIHHLLIITGRPFGADWYNTSKQCKCNHSQFHFLFGFGLSLPLMRFLCHLFQIQESFCLLILFALCLELSSSWLDESRALLIASIVKSLSHVCVLLVRVNYRKLSEDTRKNKIKNERKGRREVRFSIQWRLGIALRSLSPFECVLSCLSDSSACESAIHTQWTP